MMNIHILLLCYISLLMILRSWSFRIIKNSIRNLISCRKPKIMRVLDNNFHVKSSYSLNSSSSYSTESILSNSNVEGDENIARERLIFLNKELNRHDELYYNENDPEISDNEYDNIILEARNLVIKFPSLKGIVERLENVGGSSSSSSSSSSSNIKTSFLPIQHPNKMLSLDNAFSHEDLSKFVEKVIKAIQNQDEYEHDNNVSDILPNPHPHPNSNTSSNMNIDNLDLIIEPKIDGLSLSLVYENGVLTTAATRGDGMVGEDVTANIRYISDIPQELPVQVNVNIKGEVYMEKSYFLALNENRTRDEEKPFSNPRNAAAGSLRQLDPTVSRARNLRFIAYDLTPLESTPTISTSHLEMLNKLKNWNFYIPNPLHRVSFTEHEETMEEVTRVTKSMEEERYQWNYDADGSVVKVNLFNHQEILGNGRRAPHWAIARKFQAKEGVTILKNIVVQVGRTGVLTPVAILEPITLGGVVVERASMHNLNEINRLGASIGCRVTIQRSGDVIPKIVNVLKDEDEDEDEDVVKNVVNDSKMADMFESCPACGTATVIDGDSGTLIRCPAGLSCNAQAIERINHFCSRDAADLDGVGPRVVQELFETGLITNIADLYRLNINEAFTDLESKMKKKKKSKSKNKKTTENENSDNQDNQKSEDEIDEEDKDADHVILPLSMVDRKGWGIKSITALLDSIDSKRELTFIRFLFGLGVRHVGIQMATDIAEKSEFLDFEALWKYLRSENERLDILRSNNETWAEADIAPKLQLVRGLGPKAAHALVELYANEDSRQIVEDLYSLVTVIPPEKEIIDDSAPKLPFSNEIFVFTGKLKSMTRAEAKKVCKSLGGSVQSDVTETVTIVVSGEGSSARRKLEKATGKGLKIWNEEEWLEKSKSEGYKDL